MYEQESGRAGGQDWIGSSAIACHIFGGGKKIVAINVAILDKVAALIDAELRKVTRKAIDKYWLMGTENAKEKATIAILSGEE